MKRNLFLLLLCLFLGVAWCSAQSQHTVIKGTVRDSITGEPLAYASVVARLSDSTVASSVFTKDNGSFELRNVPFGQVSVTVSFVGYTPLVFPIRASNAATNVGVLTLKTSNVRLSEVVVTGLANEMRIRKDTIEYNAAAFKVTEGATVEELVKKLPGAEVSEDGKITVGGKEITKVLLDGKTFFSDDPKIATKNLPASMVEKLQVVDRKSEQARFTGIDDGNEETVLNLTVRPGMKNGWFGNAIAGGGYKDKWQGGGMASNLKDDRQLSVIASGNNTNNEGFNNIAGSMMQQGRGGGGGGGTNMGGSGMNVNIGGTRMSIGGNGISTSWLGGLNAHDEFTNLILGGNYFYNGVETATNTDSYRQNLFRNDSVSYSNQSQRSLSHSEGHRASVELEWTLDSLNSIVFKPNVSYGMGRFDDYSEYSILNNLLDSVNNGITNTFGDNQSLSFNGDLLLRHKFKTKGRTLSANFTLGYQTNTTDGNNYSLMRLFDASMTNDTIDQQYHSNTLSYTGNVRVSYTEPLGNNYYAEAAYSVRTNYSTSDKETFNQDIFKQYTEIDTLYSNHYQNLFVNQQADLNLRSVREKYQWTIGVGVQPSYLRSNRAGGDIERSVVNFSPNGNFIYNFSDSKQLRATYRGRTTQPSISQLQPVPDNSNPLLERLGNDDLAPEFSHNIRLFYRATNPRTFRTIVSGLNTSVTMDKIVNNTIYESSTGKQLILPVNVNNVYSTWGMFMFTSPFAKGSRFYVTTNTSVMYSQNVNLSTTVEQIDKDRLPASDENKTNSLSANERLRLSYKGSKIDLGADASAVYSKAWYSVGTKDQPTYWTNRVGGDFIWTMPWSMSFSGNANYNFYYGYSDNYNKPVMMCNAAVSKLLFKKKQATLTLQVFDILNEGRGNNRTTTDNYIEDVTTNTLGRYLMLSFTYRFGSFGNDNRQMNFIRPDGPGGGRRPM
ncbi:MAG: TonB-dependent receptor [Prevotellaceae bacterium]|jgi:hypothetical protein|nr:TonB-dependent receptor [Prevotellaceae bacterium]